MADPSTLPSTRLSTRPCTRPAGRPRVQTGGKRSGGGGMGSCQGLLEAVGRPRGAPVRPEGPGRSYRGAGPSYSIPAMSEPNDYAAAASREAVSQVGGRRRLIRASRSESAGSPAVSSRS
jgi:hypothetical protein